MKPGSELWSEPGFEPESEVGSEPGSELGSELRSEPGLTLSTPLVFPAISITWSEPCIRRTKVFATDLHVEFKIIRHSHVNFDTGHRHQWRSGGFRTWATWRGNGGWFCSTCPAGFSLFCHFFFTQNKEGWRPSRAPPLDPRLATVKFVKPASAYMFLFR